MFLFLQLLAFKAIILLQSVDKTLYFNYLLMVVTIFYFSLLTFEGSKDSVKVVNTFKTQ